MPYTLRLHLIEGDRISSPDSNGNSNIIIKLENGHTIYNGVEVTVAGEIVAYHICNTYPNISTMGIKK